MTVRCSRENGTLSLSDSMKYWRISGRIDSKRNLRRGQVASIKGGTRGGREGGRVGESSFNSCLSGQRQTSVEQAEKEPTAATRGGVVRGEFQGDLWAEARVSQTAIPRGRSAQSANAKTPRAPWEANNNAGTQDSLPPPKLTGRWPALGSFASGWKPPASCRGAPPTSTCQAHAVTATH